jgi:myosin heavy subunit
MAEEQGKLTTLAGEAVRTRVELEDVNHRLVSAQRRIEELQSSEAQLKGAIKEASIARGQSETRENELLRLYESARHDAEDLNKRWMESQSLCDGIAKERDELRSECSASKEQIAELDARLTTLSRQHEEVKANHKIVAEQSLKRHRALKKTQAALTEVQVRLNEAVERESQSRDECNDLKAKLASSRMEHEMAVAHANNLQASLEASRQDCAVLSDALMFAKTESSNLLSIKDSMNAELNCRVRALEERLHEMGCQMDGMVSKELHLKSEQEWRDVSAHYDERFKEHNDQFSAAALIIEGCCSRLSRSLVHDDLCEVMSRALPDNRRYTIQPTYSPSTSPEARLRIALESMQQCTDAVIDASIGASGVVASLLNYLINSTNSRPHLSARNNGSEEDKDLESSFDKIWVIDDDSDDVFGADNIANMPYLGTTFGLIRENAAFNKTRSPRRSQSADSTVLSPSASRPEVTASSMGLMVLAGSVKELSELHMNTAARRKLENDRIDAKKSEKYRNMKVRQYCI